MMSANVRKRILAYTPFSAVKIEIRGEKILETVYRDFDKVFINIVSLLLL